MRSIGNVRPVLNSSRPTVNRNLLTDDQVRKRDEEILGKSLTAAGEGAAISAGVNMAANKLRSGELKPGESVSDASVHGGLAGLFRALYELGKDGVDTLVTGRVGENVGEYEPNLEDTEVREKLIELATKEINDGLAFYTADRKITTPTLNKLGIVINPE